MSGIDGWGEAAQRAAEESRRLAEARLAEERAIQLAARLPQALENGNARAPEQTARLLVELSRLPPEGKARFLDAASEAGLIPAAPGGAETLSGRATTLRDQVALAFPESSDGRARLGAALVKLRGGEPLALARSVLDQKAAVAIAGLASLAPLSAATSPAPASTAPREPPRDEMERRHSFGPFGKEGPAARLRAAYAEVTADRKALTAALAPSTLATAQVRTAVPASQVAPGPAPAPPIHPLRVAALRFDEHAGSLLAPIASALAERLPALAQNVVRARESLWSRDDPGFRVRLGVTLADAPLTRAMEATSALLSSAPALASPAEWKETFTRLRSLREGLAEVRGLARAAAVELEAVAFLARGPHIRTAVQEIQQLETGAQRAENELRLASGQTTVLAESEESAFADDTPAAGTTTSGAPDGFTDADLAALGTGLDPNKPPAQTLWNENMVNLVSAEGRKQGGLSEAQGAQNAEWARQALAEGGATVEMTAVDLAAVLKRSGLALPRVDPNQVVAATRYLNTATTVADQQEKLRKVLDNFQTLARIGLPRMNREQLMGQLDTYAKVPGQATAKLAEADLRAKFTEVAGALNGGGAIQTKVGKYDLKLQVDATGQVLASSCKKPGFFSKVGSFLKKVAPIALTALSFMGGPVTAGIARVAQGVISAIQAARSKSLLGFATAAAGVVAGGAAALASKTVSIAGSVANRVASVANATARGLQGFSAVRQGSLLSGVANIGGAMASGLGSFASGVGSRLGAVAKQLGDASDHLLKGATVVSAAQAYRGASGEADAARKALRAAQASGDPRAVAEATARLQAAERARTGALFSGLGSAALMAADVSGGRRSPGTGQPVDRPPASGLEAGLRAASRGLNLTGNVVTRDYEAASVNALGAVAAVRSARVPQANVPVDAAERAAADRVRDLLGGRTRVSTLNDLSNVADAALGYRQSDKANAAATQAVATAETALATARLLANPAAVRVAEEQLREARRGAEGALMGSIGAGDALLGTARVAGEQRHLVQAEEGAVRHLASSLRLEQELQGSEELLGHADDRDRASGLRVGLEVFRRQYERNLVLAAGDPQRLSALNAGFEALVASAGQQAPRVQLASNRVPGSGAVTDASVGPGLGRGPATTETSLALLRERSGIVLEQDKRTLKEEQAQILAEATETGAIGMDPERNKTRDEYRRSVEAVERLRDDPQTTESELLAAIIDKNSARLAFQAARNPTPSDPSPLMAGVSTFFEEIGQRGLAIVSLGGTAAVREAVDQGRLDGRSSELDTAKVYLEGILNGITFGGLSAFADSYSGAGKSLGASLLDGLKAGGSSLIGIDDFTILMDPQATAAEKTAAGAALMSRVALVAAGGLAKTRYAETQVTNPFARRAPVPPPPALAPAPPLAGTSPGAAEGTIDPKSAGPGEGGVNLLEPKQVQPKPQGVQFGKPRGGGGSPADRAYASEVTGGAEKAIYVNGVEFESVRGGVLIDAKRASAKGSFYDISGTDTFTRDFKIPEILRQANRQVNAIQGQAFKGIRWEIADSRVAAQLRRLFQLQNIPIAVVHTPGK